jgi:hypothetical protein
MVASDQPLIWWSGPGREEGAWVGRAGFRGAVGDAEVAVLCTDASPPVPVQ